MDLTMRVGFGVKLDRDDASTGKEKFLIRLSNAMKDLGVTITNKKPDIYLRMADKDRHSKATVNVLRLDGLWFNTDQSYYNRNKKILKAIKKSDALVYQGQFCKDAYRRFLGVKKKEYSIITNGADPNDFYVRDRKNFFIANCRWRPHKRLKDTIKSFLLANEKGLDADLIITGKPDYVKKHARIKYVGWQNSFQLKTLLSNAIASLHLTWLDWCPNAMIEAIVACCPVIYTNSGGHNEIGEGFGISITDTQWKFKACKLYEPPKIDRSVVAGSMIKMQSEQVLIEDNQKFHIDNIAKLYLEYFKCLLK